MLSRSGFDRKVERCALMMIIAANLPDVDGVPIFFNPAVYIQWHRGYTHSLLLSPVMALIPPLLFLLFKKQRITLWAWGASLVGLLSHIALDSTNIYGIRLLMPASARWFRLDTTDLFDPWILGALFLALAAPALARLVGSEIASKNVISGPRRGWAWFALIAVFSYDAGRYIAHERVIAEMSAHLVNGTIPRRISAMPRGTTPLLWKGVAEGSTAESGNFVQIVPIDLSELYDPTAGRIDYSALPANGTNPAIEAVRGSEAFRIFIDFDQLPFWKVTPSADGTRVELIDLRFGSPQYPGFEASARVDVNGAVHDARVSFLRR